MDVKFDVNKSSSIVDLMTEWRSYIQIINVIVKKATKLFFFFFFKIGILNIIMTNLVLGIYNNSDIKIHQYL